MSETYEERKSRVLRACPESPASLYDTAYLFGYEPESWDGMWKLHATFPILQLSRNWAIAFEYSSPRSRFVRPRLVRAVDARRA